VKATMKHGSAQRTERRMMNSIPWAELKSVRGSPRQIAMLVASASSQNKRQELSTCAITANRNRACGQVAALLPGPSAQAQSRAQLARTAAP
jgi:hypothetical protein